MTFSHAATSDQNALLKEVISSPQGLTHQEAEQRLSQHGKNELHQHETAWWQLLARQLRSPFIYLLLFAGSVSLFVGELLDGSLILAFIAINLILSFLQEYHSERTLRLLKQFVSPSCNVLRDGHVSVLPSAQLVIGDVIKIQTGDIIPADIRLLEEQNLTVDESAFTGESVEVRKSTTIPSKSIDAIYQATNLGFSGSVVVSGNGTGIVYATGHETVLGTVTTLTVETARESNFEKGISRFSAFILRLVIVTIVGVFVAHLLLKPGTASPLELLLFSIALAISVVPEALPVVMTVCLSKGARQLAKDHVVVKRLSAIEDLGSIEILCTDKTGTITENNLSVAAVYGKEHDACLLAAARASTTMGDTTRQANNSFDIAVWRALNDAQRDLARQTERKADLPFDPKRRRNSVLVAAQHGLQLIVRGAPEAIMPYANNAAADATAREHWLKEQGQHGRRVIAVATSDAIHATHYTQKDEERPLHLLGLIAFEDPIKSTATQAIKEARRLGVRVKILTGDHPEVARAVAEEVGLVSPGDRVLSGEEWEQLSHDERTSVAQTCAVFARVSPEQKYHIIQHLEETHAVGFLGEGINDAPALKMAHIGIVVNNASDVAREAADVVLLERSLEVIIQGIRGGREVFANTLKYIRITLSTAFGNFYAIACASFILPELPMLPVQILLVNLLSDTPMVAIATDHVDPLEVKRPRPPDVKDVILLATILGLVSTVFDFIFFGTFRHREIGVLRTQWFLGSILTELVFIYSARTRRFFLRASTPSFTLVMLTTAIGVLTIGLPFTPFGQQVFSFVHPDVHDLSMTLGIVIAYFVANECAKLLYLRFFRELDTSTTKSKPRSTPRTIARSRVANGHS